MLRLCFHSFYQIKIKRNLVVQIPTAENGLSVSTDSQQVRVHSLQIGASFPSTVK